MPNYTKRAVHGAAVVGIMSVLASAIGYGLRIILAKNLAPAEFGLVYSVIALFGMIYLFQHLGLNDALTFCVSKHGITKNFGHVYNAIRYVLRLQVIVALVIGVVLASTSGWLAAHYFGNPAAQNLILIHALLLILLPFETVFQSIFQGMQMMKYYSGVNLLRIIVSIIFTVIFLKSGLGPSSVFYAYLICATLPFVLWMPLTRSRLPKMWKEFWAHRPGYSIALQSELFGFSVPVIFTAAAGVVMSYTDTMILTAFRTLDEVGLYNAAVPTASLLWVISSSLSIVTFPMVSELWHTNKHKVLQNGIESLYKYSMMLILPVALAIFAYPEFILSTLFGTAYIPATVPLRMLSLGAILYTLGRVNDAVFYGIGKPKISSKIAIIASVTNLALNLALIPRYGMIGAAAATITGFAITLVLGVRAIRNEIRFAMPIAQWIKTIAASIVFLASVWAVGSVLAWNPYLEAIVCVITGFAGYLAVLFASKALSYAEIKEIVARI